MGHYDDHYSQEYQDAAKKQEELKKAKIQQCVKGMENFSYEEIECVEKFIKNFKEIQQHLADLDQAINSLK